LGRYVEIKSNFIKNLIKGRSFSDREFRVYIDRLIMLEKIILEGVKGYAEAALYNDMQRYYRREWEAIYRELKSEEFSRLMEKEKRLKALRESKDRVLLERVKKEEEELKKEWIELGGVE